MASSAYRDGEYQFLEAEGTVDYIAPPGDHLAFQYAIHALSHTYLPRGGTPHETLKLFRVPANGDLEVFAQKVAEAAADELHDSVKKIWISPADTSNIYVGVSTGMDDVRRVAGGSGRYPKIPAEVKRVLCEPWAALGNLTKGMLLRVVAPTLNGEFESLWGIIRATPKDPYEPFLFDMLILQQRRGQALLLTPSVMQAQKPLNHILVKSTIQVIELKNASGFQRTNIHWQRLYLPAESPDYEEIDLLRRGLAKNTALLDCINDTISRLQRFDMPVGSKVKIIYGPWTGRCGTVARCRILPRTRSVSLHVVLRTRDAQEVVQVLLGHTRLTPTVGDIVTLGDSKRGFIKKIDQQGAVTVDDPFQRGSWKANIAEVEFDLEMEL